jgi:hypothetical protein
MNTRLRLVTDACPSPRRFRPRFGHFLTMANVRGPWRPSGAVGGAGVFAIIWEAHSGPFWAPLHDFDAPTQLRLIDACLRLDDEQFGRPR